MFSTITRAVLLACLISASSLAAASASAAGFGTAGSYNLFVDATLTSDYVYTKTTDAPDLNLVILVNKKVVFSAAERYGYKTMDDASWNASFSWKPGDQVEIKLMDADPLSSDQIVHLSWSASNTMPLSGTIDLEPILGPTARGCSVRFLPMCYPTEADILLLGAETTEAAAKSRARSLATTTGLALNLLDGDTDPPPAAIDWTTWTAITVEQSDYFKGFAPGLFVIVAGGGKPGSRKRVESRCEAG